MNNENHKQTDNTNNPPQTPQIGTPQHIIKAGFQADLLDILQKSNEQATRRTRIAQIGGNK